MALANTFQSAGQHNDVDKNDCHLTLGCEFECILVYDELNVKEEAVDAERFVKEILVHPPFMLKCIDCSEDFQWEPEFFDKRNRDPKARNPAYEAGYWHIDEDKSAEPSYEEKAALGSARGNFSFASLEIKTRKLEFDVQPPSSSSEGHTHRVAYDQEIHAVLDRLNERLVSLSHDRLRPEHDNAYLYLNERCGFHVHVGCIENHFSVETVKHLCSTLLAWERQIDSFHSPHRITGSKLATAHTEPSININLASPSREYRHLIEDSVYNKPLSQHFIHTAHNRRQKGGFPQKEYNEDPRYGYDIDSWLSLIRRAEDLDYVRGLYGNSAKDCTLNMFNLTRTANDNPQKLIQTIEFRQHTGTLEPNSVLSYIDFVTRLVTCCHWTNDGDFNSLFAPHGKYRNASFNGVGILKELGCQDQTIEHYKALLTGKSQKSLQLDAIKQQAKEINLSNENLVALARLATRNVEDEKANSDPDNVRGKILSKLLYGGYGLFSDEDLDLLLPKSTDLQDRSRLRLGYMSSS